MQFGVVVHKTTFLVISALRKKMQNNFLLALYIDQKIMGNHHAQ